MFRTGKRTTFHHLPNHHYQSPTVPEVSSGHGLSPHILVKLRCTLATDCLLSNPCFGCPAPLVSPAWYIKEELLYFGIWHMEGKVMKLIHSGPLTFEPDRLGHGSNWDVKAGGIRR